MNGVGNNETMAASSNQAPSSISNVLLSLPPSVVDDLVRSTTSSFITTVQNLNHGVASNTKTLSDIQLHNITLTYSTSYPVRITQILNDGKMRARKMGRKMPTISCCDIFRT